TNVLLPEVSVITNIDLDHNEFLGETRFNIAFEKAGIIKPLRPVVTGTSNPEALRILENTAKDHGSELHIYDKDFKSSLIFMDDKHIVFDYAGVTSSETHTNKCREYKNLSLSATGRHQIYNASLAIRVIEILAQRGTPVPDSAVINGLLNVNFEGRFEIISQAPLIIIDSAHNPAASRALADTVKELFPAKNIILIAGIMKDKDIKGILEPLIQISDTAILTKPKGNRAAPPKKLEEYIKSFNSSSSSQFMPKSIITTDSVAEALDIAKTFRHKDCVVLVTGSFYTTGEVKELLGRSTGVLSQLRE
ncbi:MAG: Mur ligase family protein, partial [Candidatus Mariimomonas ferrooxydans]